MRQPRATAIRHDPKRTSLLRPTDARATWSVTADGENSTRSGDPHRGAGMPPGRQAVVAPPLALHANDVAQARDRRRVRGASAVPGRADQSLLASPSTSRKRRWQCDQVTAVVRVPRGGDRRGAGAASPTAHAAKRRCAARTMQSQNSSLCAGRAIYSFSPHMTTKQLCLRVETRRKRSVHSRRLSRRILALTLQLTILPAQ